MHVLLSFDWHLLQQRLVEPGSQYWLALSATVAIAIVAMVMGIVLGFIAWAGTRSSFRPPPVLAYPYAPVFRGTPVIVQIFFVSFGANLFPGLNLSPTS